VPHRYFLLQNIIVTVLPIHPFRHTDYNSFKQELIVAIDLEGPKATEYANSKWPDFGQQFLQLCISHKTGSLNTSECVHENV
jgi:hypothetical protein